MDSASTDVAWGHGCRYLVYSSFLSCLLIPVIVFNNKILTSARNGELILWDLNKSGVTKYGAWLFFFVDSLLTCPQLNLSERTENERSHSLD